MTSRNYCFTSFLTSIVFDPNTTKYLIYGVETCPTTSRQHLQGYVEFTAPKSITAAKKILGDPAVHLEKRKGTRDQAITYCKKDGVITEFGDVSIKQGSRTDIKDIVTECKDIGDVMDKYPDKYCQYTKGLSNLMARKVELQIPDWRFIDVSVYYGDAGSGKTRSAVEETLECGNTYYMLSQSSDVVWFDGYRGQPILIIDDFYGWIKYGMFLKILDGYKLQIPVKGGFVWAQWNMVYITSNKSPSEWYTQGLTPALKRRLGFIKEFKNAPPKINRKRAHPDPDENDNHVSDVSVKFGNFVIGTDFIFTD